MYKTNLGGFGINKQELEQEQEQARVAVNANVDSAANVNVFHARLPASRVAEQKLEGYYAYITICSMFVRPIS